MDIRVATEGSSTLLEGTDTAREVRRTSRNTAAI